VKICPTCGRAWIPLGEEPAECPTCRHAIGMCALVGGRVRGEVGGGETKHGAAAAKEEP
jgi:hypothetical protein